MVIVSTILLHDMINRRIIITLYCRRIIIDICYIYFDTLMLGVSHAVEVLVLCLLAVVKDSMQQLYF